MTLLYISLPIKVFVKERVCLGLHGLCVCSVRVCVHVCVEAGAVMCVQDVRGVHICGYKGNAYVHWYIGAWRECVHALYVVFAYFPIIHAVAALFGFVSVKVNK